MAKNNANTFAAVSGIIAAFKGPASEGQTWERDWANTAILVGTEDNPILTVQPSSTPGNVSYAFRPGDDAPEVVKGHSGAAYVAPKPAGKGGRAVSAKLPWVRELAMYTYLESQGFPPSKLLELVGKVDWAKLATAAQSTPPKAAKTATKGAMIVE